MRRFKSRLAVLRRRWRRREEGAAAVEFALIAMVFFWLFLGIIELGMLMIFNNGLEDGVDRAARLIRTGQAFKQNISADQFRKKICEYVVLRTQCNSALMVDVRTFPDFASIRNLPQPADSGSGFTMPTNYRIGAPRQVVLVRAFYVWDFFTPLIGKLLSNTGGDKFLVSAATTFRNEPYGSK